MHCPGCTETPKNRLFSFFFAPTHSSADVRYVFLLGLDYTRPTQSPTESFKHQRDLRTIDHLNLLHPNNRVHGLDKYHRWKGGGGVYAPSRAPVTYPRSSPLGRWAEGKRAALLTTFFVFSSPHPIDFSRRRPPVSVYVFTN